MAKIKQLPPHEAQKIAAGEVVERPANVVKELIENALDAEATNISLYLEDGGKKLIRIVDNGCGMSPEDARLSILHHATSKISSVNDLELINTFGFRGEALSSIASVSRMIISTKEATDETGVSLEIDAGTPVRESVVSINTGTDITIQDLFYTVPARLKFLKTKETEWRTIVHLFHALCLSYQKVSFTLHHEGRLIYTMPAATSLADRINQLFEPAVSKNIHLFEASQERMRLHISGALTAPHYTRFDRNQIFVFVNQRWVKNHKLVQALIKGYQGMMQPNRYPAGFLFITLDPEFVDINIHPRKEEVQFLHPRIVEELIETTARKCLEGVHSKAMGNDPLLPHQTWTRGAVTTQWSSAGGAQTAEMQNSTNNAAASLSETSSRTHDTSAPGKLTAGSARTMAGNAVQSAQQIESIKKQAHISAAGSARNDQSLINSGDVEAQQAAAEVQSQQAFLNVLETEFENSKPEQETPGQQLRMELDDPTITKQANYRLIGQLKQTYILIETAEGLVLVDQHAAHERIMYERLRNRFEEVVRVRLLFPQIISLTREDATLFEPYLELLLEFGIEAQLVSDRELAISETPVFLKNQSLEDCIKQAISALHEYQYLDKDELKKIIYERVHAQLSCKAAVKAGDELSTESMHELIKELHTTENKLTCPHGRPTLWEFKSNEIEKKFKRDYR